MSYSDEQLKYIKVLECLPYYKNKSIVNDENCVKNCIKFNCQLFNYINFQFEFNNYFCTIFDEECIIMLFIHKLVYINYNKYSLIIHILYKKLVSLIECTLYFLKNKIKLQNKKYLRNIYTYINKYYEYVKNITNLIYILPLNFKQDFGFIYIVFYYNLKYTVFDENYMMFEIYHNILEPTILQKLFTIYIIDENYYKYTFLQIKHNNLRNVHNINNKCKYLQN
jgi:hypothetical protein